MDMDDTNVLALTPTSSSGASSSLDPSFRSACEECHRRKVRCVPSNELGCCEACHAGARRCIFGLRSKIGRPRRDAPRGHKSSPDVPTLASKGPSRKRSLYNANPSPPMSLQMLAATQTASPSAAECQLATPQTECALEDLFADHDAEYSEITPAMNDSSDQLDMFPTGLMLDRFTHDSDTGGSMDSQPEGGDPFTMPPWPIPHPHTITGRRTNEDQDFGDALKICSQVHRRSEMLPLSLVSSADQAELNLVLQTIDDLRSKTQQLAYESPAAMTGVLPTSKWMIIRVAVLDAIHLCADLIDYNVQIHALWRIPDDAAGCALDEPCDACGAKVCRCPAWQDEVRLNTVLRIVLWLVHLDYSIAQFGSFMTQLDFYQHQGHDDHDRADGGGGLACPSRCGCLPSTNAKLEGLRSQIGFLIEKLRSRGG